MHFTKGFAILVSIVCVVAVVLLFPSVHAKDMNCKNFCKVTGNKYNVGECKCTYGMFGSSKRSPGYNPVGEDIDRSDMVRDVLLMQLLRNSEEERK